MIMMVSLIAFQTSPDGDAGKQLLLIFAIGLCYGMVLPPALLNGYINQRVKSSGDCAMVSSNILRTHNSNSRWISDNSGNPELLSGWGNRMEEGFLRKTFFASSKLHFP